MEFVVSHQEHGLSLLAFLKEKCKETLSVKKIKKAIDAKSCTVNGRVEFFSSFLVREGDRVVLKSVASFSSELSILFQDEYFVIIDKPPGMVCEEGLYKEQNWTLVHRLDKDTSGLLLFSKNAKAEEALKALFAKREIKKLYLAIVDGRIKGKKGIIDNYLGKKAGYQGQTLYGEVADQDKGLRAITHWHSLATSETASLVLCDLKTGRTHQIRVHFTEKGHPILGDHQYVKKSFICDLKPSRHLLHAWKLSFIHPFTQKEIEVEAPIPLDFKSALEVLNLNMSSCLLL